ncbi:hypothetical protein SAMN02745163_01421 [Clostridium cavendishii DSM 21758]|uniref:Uncharacterized protein n=1 Tax=Clostridium cavendishii DSM 21758 TaxID=1121302 RepID=A0A1M6GXR9_9CLOT|nr:hypothetical protein [Clostridium cavendishii]SHJ14721.1 hypothetical protein SAMN02745163_01421 [Clostridium cavendishii DSM 21758]
MPNSTGKNFFKFISSLIKFRKEAEIDVTSDEHKEYSYKMPKSIKRIWKKEYRPFRKKLLWGVDKNNNPSVIIFYGLHAFKDMNSKGIAKNNLLEEEIRYVSYAIFRGKNGHFTSFQAVKILWDEDADLNSDESYNNGAEMYLKKGLKFCYYYWKRDEAYKVKEFVNLPEEKQIVLPYYEKLSYYEIVQRVKEKNINFSDFRLVGNPDDILKLAGELETYSQFIINILSNTSLYLRKKSLKALLDMNPSKEVYNKILEIGSSEVIAGLFLEFAKRRDDSLMEEARNFAVYDSESYAQGVKRCVDIYITSVDDNLRTERIKWIHDNMSKMDFHLMKVNGTEVPDGKILNGATYRKYASSGILQDYYYNYDYEKRKYIWSDAPQRYKKSQYNDGVKVKLIEFKDTIQEADIYGLADVMGKIAYFLDAPRLNYYFKGSEKGKALRYFKRYVRRAIDDYSINDPQKFMEAMKLLLCSYNNYDYLCKFPKNFQFNEFIKHYLYDDFKEKAPTGWNNWSERYEFIHNDQLMKLKGRYEFKKEIWDDNLEVVAEIATISKLDVIVKACYYILKDSPKAPEFIENMGYKNLIELSLVYYKPLANMFNKILKDKLNKVESFDSSLMIALIGASNEELNKVAMEYFKNTNGAFSAKDTADLLFLDNLDNWLEIFESSINYLEGATYLEFVDYVISSIDKYRKAKVEISKGAMDILLSSSYKVKELGKEQQIKVLSNLVDILANGVKMTKWISSFIEAIIFAVDYDMLKQNIEEISITFFNKTIPSRSKEVLSLLNAIKNNKIPTDAEIISILERGTASTINILFNIINRNINTLKDREKTLLIMFESEVAYLNDVAYKVFDRIEGEDKKKLHLLIIDSPVKRAYSFGLRKLEEIYGEVIPEEFIVQMLESNSTEVKEYISDKVNKVLKNLGDKNQKLFIYYVKTMLLLPNKVSKGKDNIYNILPKFVISHRENSGEIKAMLMDIGGSNIIKDSEKALVTLAKIRKEEALIEG